MAKSLKEIILPDLGEGIEGAEVSEVSVAVGDTLSQGDTIVVLESDKASMEIPSDDDGVVKEVLVATGKEVNVGDLLIKLEIELSSPPKDNKEDKVESTTDDPSAAVVVQPPETKPEPDPQPSIDGKIFASPGVRRLARELSINLQHITPSGDKGRITKEDLNNYIKIQMSNQLGVAQSINKDIDYAQWGDIEEIKLSKIKKITGRRLQEAWQSIPHVTQFDEADITDLDRTRRKMKKELEKKDIKITFLPFLMKAVVEVLQSMPEFNSSLNHTSETLIIKQYYNIGIAVDTPNGLIVPVIRDVDKKTISDLSIGVVPSNHLLTI